MSQFIASRLKIERAKQHINDLDSRIRLFAATDFYRVSVQTHVEAGGDGFNIEITKSCQTISRSSLGTLCTI
jgi:hypothetical protein